jgi:hypothetical protein
VEQNWHRPRCGRRAGSSGVPLLAAAPSAAAPALLPPRRRALAPAPAPRAPVPSPRARARRALAVAPSFVCAVAMPSCARRPAVRLSGAVLVLLRALASTPFFLLVAACSCCCLLLEMTVESGLERLASALGVRGVSTQLADRGFLLGSLRSRYRTLLAEGKTKPFCACVRHTLSVILCQWSAGSVDRDALIMPCRPLGCRPLSWYTCDVGRGGRLPL